MPDYYAEEREAKQFAQQRASRRQENWVCLILAGMLGLWLIGE
jgi:hypothetical protein